MKSSEKRLIALALALLLAVLALRIVPLARDFYGDGLAEAEQLEQRIHRYRLLMENEPFLVDEEGLKREEVAELESWLFPASDPNLVGSSVQRQLRQAVDQANVSVRQISVARYAEVEGWLVVTQEMDFTIEQADILRFLDLLETSRPRLHITEFSITRNRRQYTGAVTVTGFSRALPQMLSGGF